ncbi:FAD-dependent monooxygenase [Pedobacter jeongneungensis]|uniref:FAD-dependent monooxygenase n=1 Tax=Pedobacter jeongneungensis TaxID=947309 RepID=UPI00046AB706|nr:FAD-dependent monooxygenase [Pedobacter jeongneungensis]
MKNSNILVSGASIAGLTLAFWLDRYGFKVTVVERCTELRLGGQNIDVKGSAWEIMKMMGLEHNIKQANTTEIGIRFVDQKNNTLAEFPKEDALSMTQEMEILRGDFVKILYEKVKENVAFRFGERIEGIEVRNDKVNIAFSNGQSACFDLVIIAEGIGSSTREKVFGTAVTFRYLGLYTSYFTAARKPSDNQWARWHNAPGGIVFLIRPDNHGSTRVCINFRSKEQGFEKLSIQDQKEILLQRIKDAEWEAPRLKKDIQESEDFYMERLSQVLVSKWSKGRVAMIGDAAYCVTPIGGKGTDLAVAGAYIIAGELHNNANYQHAFESFENQLRPFVEKVQKLPPGVPGLVYPKSRTGVNILNTLFSIAGSKPAKYIMRLFSRDKKAPQKDLELKHYSGA